MASIESLLNPLPSPKAPQKKPKLAKDAPIFTRGTTKGPLRYPPCEDRTDELAQIHRAFNLHPMGEIALYPRHIPYNSDKKTFQEKTGRESFEVFQYTFQIPGHDKQWTISWDYNIGLVRTTHLFKSQQYSKTTPAKVLAANPGLRDISHSITGGAIAAQGYWMPFAAAKAVAATFCWNIRYVLTPVFGVDFPSLCVRPGAEGYGGMRIDADIVAEAAHTATYYRLLQRRSPDRYCVSPGSVGTFTPVNGGSSLGTSRSDSPVESLEDVSDGGRGYGVGGFAREIKAAHALLSLCQEVASDSESIERRKRRRASA
ncbi:transcription regulator HTH, apses-type DNA-binding domain-containing protein [Aspergillus coremiiformis]|uniref:Transcription regulator HTH, apses-type DNA-binding domain-containing protein n=1 Tax=Aspergillus coremiiformis TaxID=138285 RepID=A0A5N6ZBA1_9EURO|nr:transcription regulator HTH, apses-type DNA-binding domain-containing protein [Aspergillus coremiiformis]